MGVIICFSDQAQSRRRATAAAAPAISFAYPRPAAERNAPLRCLAGGVLAGRFDKWRAASGRFYVFSIFPVRSGVELGGLPDFESAVALAVGFDSLGAKRRLGAFELCWRDGVFAGDGGAVATALRLGASEWHVHLLAQDGEARRALLDDLMQ